MYSTSLSCKIQNGRHEITKVIRYSSIIEIATTLFHRTIIFSLSRNAKNKRYMYSTSLLCKIQNGRHEITEVGMSSSTIEIETKVFHKTMFPVSMDAIDTRYLYMTSLHVSYKIQNDRHNIISKVIISPSIFETEANFFVTREYNGTVSNCSRFLYIHKTVQNKKNGRVPNHLGKVLKFHFFKMAAKIVY